MTHTASRRDGIASSARQRAAIDGWLDTLRSSNTRAAYGSDLDLFVVWCASEGSVPLKADTTALVAFQAARVAAGDSRATIRRRWSALSSFFAYAVAAHLRSTNPSHGVDRPKVAKGDPSPTAQLSARTVAHYRATAAAIDPRLDALVSLLVVDGLKVAEALALDIGDVAGRSPTTVALRRRGTITRLAIHRDTARAVRTCMGERDDGPVFISERSSTTGVPLRLTRFGADHLIRRLRSDDDAEPVTANALRRFHIVARRESGADLDDVRARAGLADVRSVMRYADRGPDVH